MNVKHIGIITEYKIKLWFMEKGFVVCEPIGDNSRYDFLVEIKNHFVRFQSKTGNLTRTENCLNFACASMRHNETKGNYRAKYTKDEIDYFVTIHPETNQIYIVPVEECANECNLRFVPPKNNSFKGVKMAIDYEGDKMIERITLSLA